MYDRIILVAHSLGSIIAYDILKHAFARINRYVDDDQQARQPKREELKALLRDPEAFSLDKFQELQRECREELNELGNPWIVRGFIMLGSPLTHAEFLMGL